MNRDAKDFLNALCPSLPEDERLIVCGFPGNPNDVPGNAWRPRGWTPGAKLPLSSAWNAYVTIASFREAADGTWRRRGELFAAGRAIMVDDIGTKVDAAIVDLPPSAIIETSPDNFQWWYFLTEPERDPVRFDGLLRAFIAGKLLGADPGMAGITRVGRLPGYLNGKPQYGGFTTRLEMLSDVAYSFEELLEGFGLELRGRREPLRRLPTEEALERNRQFMEVYKFLAARGMLKRSEPDMSGWTEMTCPWVDCHTNGADNGAAISEPSEENGWTGGFRCHHGHCKDKGWRDLTDWLNELAVEELERINEEAHK